MASAAISVRQTRTGERRFVVRYRLGGRAFPLVHAGSFKTMKEARARRDLVAGELAAGRNPAHLLRALADTTTTQVVTVGEWGGRFLSSRIDLDQNTRKNYKAAFGRIAETFGDRDPATITASEIAEWIATMAETRKPGTLGQYLIVFRLLLDHVGLAENVARDPRVKLPKRVREEPQPPSREHFEKILAALPARWRLLFVTIEQGALRLGEAVNLKWGDVDRDGSRLRLPRSATKRDRARWVYLPAWVIEAIDQTCAFEDRTPDRRVFQGVTEATAYQAMTRACQNAGVPHYHPHDLRHRRISMWHHQGVPARELAERAGHAKPSMSLDVYSHVMPTAEVSVESFRAMMRN